MKTGMPHVAEIVDALTEGTARHILMRCRGVWGAAATGCGGGGVLVPHCPPVAEVAAKCGPRLLTEWHVEPTADGAAAVVTPTAEHAEAMRSRATSLLAALSDRGLDWRFDSRLMCAYVRDGPPKSPPEAVVVETVAKMRFLVEMTPYAEMIKVRAPHNSLAALRAACVRHYLDHGGDPELVPKSLRQ